jgi:hypothetical protein
MSDTSYAAYRAAVESHGQSIQERVKDGDDEGDALHEEVDGSYWVIYTHAAIALLGHSRNDDAGFDEQGDDFLSGCTSMSEVYTRAAFYALRADVQEWLNDNPVADEDEDEDEDEDTGTVCECGAHNQASHSDTCRYGTSSDKGEEPTE